VLYLEINDRSSLKEQVNPKEHKINVELPKVERLPYFQMTMNPVPTFPGGGLATGGRPPREKEWLPSVRAGNRHQ
jgi:hypothetical protein